MPSSDASVISVLVVDDHPLLRDGIAFGLSGEPDMRIVANAHDGRSAIAAFREHRPDVTLMDLQLPDEDGVEVTRRIVDGGLPSQVVVLTSFSDDHRVREAIQAVGVPGRASNGIGRHTHAQRMGP